MNLLALARAAKKRRSDNLRVKSIMLKYQQIPTNKKYYLIYRDSESAGFFSFLYSFFAEIEYAISKKMIPVIDMVNFNSQFGASEENIWEYFYEQPMHASLHEAYSSRNLKHSFGRHYNQNVSLSWDMGWAKDQSLLAQKRDLFQKYIRPSRVLIKHIIENATIFNDWNSTIGVTLRGTCYSTLKPYGHPIQPDPELILKRCNKLIDNGEYDSVYLATIDADIQKLFKAKFGGRLISLNRSCYSSNTSDLFKEIKAAENIYTHYMSYITSIYLLSYCRCILGGITSSSIFLPLICNPEATVDLSFTGYYGIT